MTNQQHLQISGIQCQHKFIHRIVQLMPVERIYISNHHNAHESEMKKLTIVLPKVSKIHTAEAKPLISIVMADYPDFVFSVFTVQEVKRALHYGSMVFYTICKESNLLYQSEGGAELLSADLNAKAVLKKAKRNFRKEWKKIIDFERGFQFYFEEANYALAAFMLHQVLELSYRTAELLVIGKDKTTHSIRNHQKLMQSYLIELSSIFNEKDEEEMALLTLLEEAYRSVRYELDYEINGEQLQKLSAKASLVKDLVTSVYERIVSWFIKQTEADQVTEVALVSTPEPIVNEGKPLDQIIIRICGLVPVVRIYKLGRDAKVDMRSGMLSYANRDRIDVHYYLLVICDTTCTPEVFNVQGIINQDGEIDAVVTLLVHSMKEVQDALRNGEPTFHELLCKGDLIYERDMVELEVPEMDAGQLLLHKGKLWYNRYNRAEALMEAAGNVTEEENGIVMASMLSQAMVQLCLVYIGEHIAYCPNQLSLKHLFEVCRMIDPLIDEVFPISREEDRNLFNVLLDADRNLRYKMLACVDTTDQYVLLRRCDSWMDKVKELHISEKHLGRECVNV